MALPAGRGWLTEKRKRGLLLEAAGVFGIDAPDGGLVGSVTLARYGNGHASVGMMLVAARYAWTWTWTGRSFPPERRSAACSRP